MTTPPAPPKTVDVNPVCFKCEVPMACVGATDEWHWNYVCEAHGLFVLCSWCKLGRTDGTFPSLHATTCRMRYPYGFEGLRQAESAERLADKINARDFAALLAVDPTQRGRR